MVGHQTLDLSIGVQIPVPQVNYKARAGFFYFGNFMRLRRFLGYASNIPGNLVFKTRY
jgi:hypothetical protein